MESGRRGLGVARAPKPNAPESRPLARRDRLACCVACSRAPAGAQRPSLPQEPRKPGIRADARVLQTSGMVPFRFWRCIMANSIYVGQVGRKQSGKRRRRPDRSRPVVSGSPWRFRDVLRYLESEGWVLKRMKGSHRIFSKPEHRNIVVMVQKRMVDAVYVRQVVRRCIHCRESFCPACRRGPGPAGAATTQRRPKTSPSGAAVRVGS